MKHTQGRDANWCLTALLPSNWWYQTRVIGWSAVQSKQLAGTPLNGPWKRHWGPASEIRSHSGSLVLWETGQTFNTSNQPVRLQVRGTRRQDEEKMWRWAYICGHSPTKFVHEMNEKKPLFGHSKSMNVKWRRSSYHIKLELKSQNKNPSESTFSQWDLWIYSHESSQKFPGKSQNKKLKALFAMFSSLVLPR